MKKQVEKKSYEVKTEKLKKQVLWKKILKGRVKTNNFSQLIYKISNYFFKIHRKNKR